MNNVKSILMQGLVFMEAMKTKNDIEINKILDKWDESKSYPRKMKKRIRKELQVDYSLYSWLNKQHEF